MHSLIAPNYAWLAEALFTALILGLVFSLGVGVLLLTSPRILFRLNQRMSLWIDTTEQFRKLEEPHQSERMFYRHHKVVGALVTLGATLVLWRWVVAVPKASVAVFALGRSSPHVNWLTPAIDTLIIALNSGVLLIGLVIALRPSALKNVEKTVNQWHRVPQALPLDAVVTTLDKGFVLYPRLGGLLLISTAGACLVLLLPVLLDHLRG